MRSSRGCARRSAHIASAYANIAVAAFMRSSGGTVGSNPNVNSVHSNTCLRSSSGTPTRSAIACSGNHSAMSRTRSHSPRSATESITESTRAFTWAARSLMRRGVKPLLMILRSFVCSGGSRLIRRSDVPPSFTSPVSGRNGLGAFRNVVQSCETRCTSLWRVTTQ